MYLDSLVEGDANDSAQSSVHALRIAPAGEHADAFYAVGILLAAKAAVERHASRESSGGHLFSMFLVRGS